MYDTFVQGVCSMFVSCPRPRGLVDTKFVHGLSLLVLSLTSGPSAPPCAANAQPPVRLCPSVPPSLARRVAAANETELELSVSSGSNKNRSLKSNNRSKWSGLDTDRARSGPDPN